jgi:hypothetical protein
MIGTGRVRFASCGRRLPSIAALLGAILVSAACARTEHPEPSKPSPIPKLEEDRNSEGMTMGQPIFSCGYSNSAWGRVRFGHVLDDQGRIWSYDFERVPSASTAAAGAAGTSSLSERFPNPALQSRRVPLERLAPMQKKVEGAREGRIESREVASDAGIAACYAYLRDRSGAVRSVVLGGSGNSVITNSSPEAAELQAWLRNELGMGARAQSTRK